MKTVLVVIDMQNDFITGALGSPAAQAIVPAVAKKIGQYKERGCEVVFTRDTHGEDYLDTQEGRRLPVAHCSKGTAGWQIADALDTDGCKLIDKPAFGSIELARYLKERGFGRVELCGLVSSICVVSNALIIKAHMPECEITLDAACTAGVTDEDYKASLTVMKSCQVEVSGEA
ncbi:MAG: cysteine hydrolase [Clostridiales Family XIII bacterium]|nr:cysteine hydrolase [Clostridiales Family XIII bacterium]